MSEHKGQESVILLNATLKGVVKFVEWQRGRWSCDETLPIQICYTNDYLDGRAWWYVVRKDSWWDDDNVSLEEVAIGWILAVAIYHEGKQATKLLCRPLQASEQFEWGIRKLVQAFKEMGYVEMPVCAQVVSSQGQETDWKQLVSDLGTQKEIELWRAGWPAKQIIQQLGLEMKPETFYNHLSDLRRAHGEGVVPYRNKRK